MKIPINLGNCIIIPCYNEGSEFRLKEYTDFLLNNNTYLVCFVNDGSTDDTESVLKSLQQDFEQQIIVLSSSINIGKAEAIRKGINFCNSNFNFKYIAYLDADLSTSLQECASLNSQLNEDIEFVFGSRIMKIGSTIDRKWHRFILGRIIATIISMMLKLKIYDTQCGCKVFSKELSIKLFQQSFISRWLFDVEIFFRMIKLYGRGKALGKMKEMPLKKWIDSGNSKIKITYIFKVWLDLFLIYKKYSNVRSSYYMNPKREKNNVS